MVVLFGITIVIKFLLLSLLITVGVTVIKLIKKKNTHTHLHIRFELSADKCDFKIICNNADVDSSCRDFRCLYFVFSN